MQSALRTVDSMVGWTVTCFRWWPGQICHPELIPLNIRDLPHDVGQFAVYFFGTRDYLWTHHGRYDVILACSKTKLSFSDIYGNKNNE